MNESDAPARPRPCRVGLPAVGAEHRDHTLMPEAEGAVLLERRDSAQDLSVSLHRLFDLGARLLAAERLASGNVLGQKPVEPFFSLSRLKTKA